ncbi:ZMYM5 protein, partial [Polyodon spathula]|nr:ZMYM5 protein [Polyodon spathula]
DPALWTGKLTDQEKCQLIKRGPVQIKDFDFAQNDDKVPRCFTEENYQKKMKNGEEIHRKWLVYSVSSDSVFCFCCKLFERGTRYALSSSGFRSWINLHSHSKEHENGKSHRANMQSWRELDERLKSGKTINSASQELQALEVQYWRAVLSRIIAILCYLAEHNQALRGHSEKLFEPHNGNLLGQIELMAQFDPIMSKHLRRTDKKEIKDHYVSNTIQNELIALVGQKTCDAIVQKVKEAKYFSVIMDCTPDISHTKQLSLVLHIVNCEDIDSQDLVLEVRAAVIVFPGHISSSAEMLDYIYKENLLELYGNLSIALQLLLTLPVTVASGERSVSSLKLIKTYLRSTMSKERLNGLAMISIEQESLEILKYGGHNQSFC